MPAGAEDDRHFGLLHPVDRAADVVDVGYHEIDVIIAVGRAGQDCETVMVAIGEGAQESDLARYMIRNQEVELANQRGFHGSEIGDVEHDMAEARDRGVAGLEDAL